MCPRDSTCSKQRERVLQGRTVFSQVPAYNPPDSWKRMREAESTASEKSVTSDPTLALQHAATASSVVPALQGPWAGPGPGAMGVITGRSLAAPTATTVRSSTSVWPASNEPSSDQMMAYCPRAAGAVI